MHNTTPPDVVIPQTLRVALIDHEPMILELLKSALERWGHEVQSYKSASSSHFLESETCPCPANPNCPDVIVADVDELGVNGIELLNQLYRRHCRCQNVALMTGYGVNETELIKMAKFGVRVFLKPFDISELAAWIGIIRTDPKNKA